MSKCNVETVITDYLSTLGLRLIIPSWRIMLSPRAHFHVSSNICSSLGSSSLRGKKPGGQNMWPTSPAGHSLKPSFVHLFSVLVGNDIRGERRIVPCCHLGFFVTQTSFYIKKWDRWQEIGSCFFRILGHGLEASDWHSKISYWWLCGRGTQKNIVPPQGNVTFLHCFLVSYLTWNGAKTAMLLLQQWIKKVPKESPRVTHVLSFTESTTCSTQNTQCAVLFTVYQILLDTKDIDTMWLPLAQLHEESRQVNRKMSALIVL